ncbi:MAG: hypothetical protein MJB57_02535 [Gemmatimonadetes bacterium]|nr:hypothetical protein [Gemmatimonadota bacterium]
MSRAFVDEDAASEPEPRYVLPDRGSPHYPAAAARALIEGANQGNTRSAELATGYAWGAPELVPHIETLIEQAKADGDDRAARLGRRYLKKAAG